MSKSMSENAQDRAAENGINNPSGVAIAGFAPMYLVGIPITSYLSRPGGLLEKSINAIASAVTGGSVPSDRVIPALAALYIFWTFGATGAFSAAGQAMARDAGLDSKCPRQFLTTMRGLPLRLFSAHSNLMENFPGFAVAAGLAQVLAPTNQHIVNLLGFHVVAKAFVYYPAYLLDVPPARTAAHVLAVSSVVNVCWRLALGAK